MLSATLSYANGKKVIEIKVKQRLWKEEYKNINSMKIAQT